MINKEDIDAFQKIKPDCKIVTINNYSAKPENLPQIKQPKPSSAFASAFSSIVMVSPLIYLVIQIIAAIKLRGVGRIIVLLPIPIMLIVIAVSIYGYLQEWNLWTIYLIFITPLAILYVVIVWLIFVFKKRKLKVSDSF